MSIETRQAWSPVIPGHEKLSEVPVCVLVQERWGEVWVAPMGSPPEGPSWLRLESTGFTLLPDGA